jgi:peroxiredoxin
MKKSAFILTTLLICCAITIKAQEVNVFGTVTLNGDYDTDTIYVGLYPMSNLPPGRPLPNPYYFSASTDSVFSFKVEPGIYTIGAMAFGYRERSRFHIFIPPDISNYEIKITLQPQYIAVGIADIQNVKLRGAYSQGKNDKQVSLTREGDIWKLKDLPNTLKQGQRYRFTVNGKPTIDLLNKKVIPIKNWMLFNNIYIGNELIFDPSLYSNSKTPNTIEVNGFDLNDQFQQLVSDIKEFENKQTSQLRKMYSGSIPPMKNTIDSIGKSLFNELSEIEQKYDPIFSQLFVEKQFKLYGINSALLDFPGKTDSEERREEMLRNFYLSDPFGDFFKGQLDLVQQLDPNSYLLSGDFLINIYSMQQSLDACPELSQKFNLSEKYFDEFLQDFIDDSPNEKLCCDLLYKLAVMNSYRNEAKAITFVDILKTDYPYKKYVDENAVERLLAKFSMIVGKEAPAFSVNTLNGELLKLASYKGKFVLLDFWGSWCAPCRKEIPHLKKLYQNVSRDKLDIIGIARDDSTKLCNYIQEQNIAYPNVLAPKQLLTTYAISSFPTSFLIDPNGIIIQKNLRGEKGMQQIMEDINKYFEQ